MKELSAYLYAVKEQWRRLVTGSLTIGLLSLLQQADSRVRVPGFLYWMIVCVTLLWAFFGAWKTEHRRVLTLQPLAQTLIGSLKVRCDQLIKEWAELNQLCSNDLQEPLNPSWGGSKTEFIPFRVGSLQMLYGTFYADLVRATIPMPKYNVRISLPDLLETLRDCKGKIEKLQ
jgi:hypothetical protein